MSKRISKAVRELLCAAFASTPYAYEIWGVTEALATVGVVENDLVDSLASAAFWAVVRGRGTTVGDTSTKEQLEFYAEAEALLRTGWSPP